jgi:F-type H+-transporting ATPase subunit gamma
MSSLRETKNRIRSVKNTEKITKAMKMVAASKLRRAQEAVIKPRPFARKLESIIKHLAAKSLSSDTPHPLLMPRSTKKRAEILVLSSDRGLCGALNSSVVRATQNFLAERRDQFSEVVISTIGKKGFEGLTRLGFPIRMNYLPENKIYGFSLAQKVAEEMCQRFLNNEVDAIYLVYNEFKSAITQVVVIDQLLPIENPATEALNDQIDFLYEPDAPELLDKLVPKHFATKLFQSFLESYASEQGARMTAMDNATRNAKEMTDRLTLEYNRARQAAITKELMEIIGGAEAL